MEETQKKERVVKNVEIKEEVGETSRAGGFGQRAGIRSKEEDYELEIVVHKPEEKKTIPLVPKALREKEELKKYFEPRIISIGPYHHGKENLKAGESIKLRWAKEFLKLPREGEKNEEKLLDSIRAEINELRACYDATDDHVKEDKYDDETLSRMLFVDGCSVLYYMICCLDGNFIALNLNNSDLATWQKDLILLENQLPYQVLLLLLGGMFLSESRPMQLIEFFVRWLITKPSGREPINWWDKYIPLILKLMWTSGTAATQEKPPSHLLETMQRQYICGSRGSCDKVRELIVKQRENSTRGLQEKSCSFHNVTELTAKGISLKPLLRRYGLIYIDFHDKLFLIPQLLLPSITIDNTTKTKLLNMVALEMSSPSKGCYVTSYICFLNSLISDKDDVKELKAARILYNLLGSNEELVKFFKGIADNLVPDYGIYRHVLYRIEQYLERPTSSIWSWMTEAARIYFRSPWTAIAFFGGFLAISVSIVQTYFTIFPLPDKCNKSI